MFEVISEVKINEQELARRAKIDEEYRNKILALAKIVQGSGSFIQKRVVCKRLFDWFCNNVSYDYEILKNKKDSGAYMPTKYIYNGCEIFSSEKYAAILLKKGGCTAFAEAFKDVCELLNINCKVVSGSDKEVILPTFRIAHSWNEVTIDGKRATVDLDPHFRTFMSAPRTHQTFAIRSVKK